MNSLCSLLIGTRNEGKLREFGQLLGDLPFRFLSLRDFPEVERVPETGTTFVENASLKATSYANQTGMLTLAEDSGLEAAALGGGPGVLSARYAGSMASDAKRIEKLLAELHGLDLWKRTARFVSAVAIASAGGKVLNISLGTCEGHIAFEPRGSGGFGYDPIFIPVGYHLTFAELGAQVKNQISHRARALAGTRRYLQTLTAASRAR